jgi:hypothetical protein
MTTTFTIEFEENIGPIAAEKLTNLFEDIVNRKNYTLNNCECETDGSEDDD